MRVPSSSSSSSSSGSQKDVCLGFEVEVEIFFLQMPTVDFAKEFFIGWSFSPARYEVPLSLLLFHTLLCAWAVGKKGSCLEKNLEVVDIFQISMATNEWFFCLGMFSKAKCSYVQVDWMDFSKLSILELFWFMDSSLRAFEIRGAILFWAS